MELGEFIRNRRRELGLTQEEVAAAVDMVASAISHIESGRTKQPGRATIHALARVLQTTSEHLASLTVGGQPIKLDDDDEERLENLIGQDHMLRPATKEIIINIIKTERERFKNKRGERSE